MANLIISPSDEDTSKSEKFSNILFTKNPTVVTEVDGIDESSNSSTAQYTELVSLSLTDQCKYYQKKFLLHKYTTTIKIQLRTGSEWNQQTLI